MTEKPNQARRAKRDRETVVVDGRYIREQANAALRLFLAPLSGVYDAAFGPVRAPLEAAEPKRPRDRR